MTLMSIPMIGTESEIRVAVRTREKTSRPNLPVPKRATMPPSSTPKRRVLLVIRPQSL